jgi:hypothetical protein
MHTMVVVRGEVDRCESTAGKRPCRIEICREQVFERVVDALRLQYPVAPQRAGLAKRSVGRRDDGAGIRVDRPGAFPELTDEEVVEGPEVLGYSPPDLVELDVVEPEETADQGVFDGRDADACEPRAGTPAR